MQNRIKELRKQRGMTQEQLAEALDTSNGMVSMLEKGERRLNTDWLEKLCSALSCSPSDIYGGEKTKEQALSDVINETAQRFEGDAFISPLLQSLEAAVKEREKK